MTEHDAQPRDRFTLFLAVACLVLAVLTVLLTVQNRSLKLRLAAAVNATPLGSLKAGDTIEPFDVVDAAGASTHVAFEEGKRTLLLVFSSTCGACHETIPVWNRLLADTPNTAVHVVGVETDFQGAAGAGVTLPVPDLRFPVFGSAESHGLAMGKFPAIPVATILNGKGVVESVWVGVPTDAQVAELRRALAG